MLLSPLLGSLACRATWRSQYYSLTLVSCPIRTWRHSVAGYELLGRPFRVQQGLLLYTVGAHPTAHRWTTTQHATVDRVMLKCHRVEHLALEPALPI